MAAEKVSNSSSVGQKLCPDGIESKEKEIAALLNSYSWCDLKNMKTIKQKAR